MAVNSVDTAAALFAQLGYGARLRPLDLREVPLPGLDAASYVRTGRRRREGYCLVFGETTTRPRSLRALAKGLRDHVHDRPLGVLGVSGDGGRWERMIVLRPRVSATGGGVSLTKLEVDLRHPTQHDARVLQELAWSGDDHAGQAAIDRALDVEAVTRRFFTGLREHQEALRDAVQGAIDSDVALRHHLKHLNDEPAERVALRILTQVLFCEFVQRKGLLGGRSDWLTQAFRDRRGHYYQTVLEPLFYDALGTPKAHRRPGLPDVPYLNGGLFERIYGPASLALPDAVFDLDGGLLGYLDGWTFTISEEMPEEAEVAVDPEMLGRVFEHLAGEQSVRQHGTVYTPRPVVHFMCREALVPWLQEAIGLFEAEARHLLTDPDPLAGDDGLVSRLGTGTVADLAARLPAALDRLRVIDPAVGSGAFPLGMLAEIVRLRSICHSALHGQEADLTTVYGWKLQAISHVLFGVDIEPRAIELCRLRLWLSLVVELPAGVDPDPLPNLEFRTVVADSLVDFVHGIEIQNTRGGLSFFSEPRLVGLHDRWFTASGDEKDQLRAEIAAVEDEVVRRQLTNAYAGARSEAERAEVDDLAGRFASVGRAFPCFVPALHAPDVAAGGGWDVVIMNPPYVGAKEVTQRLPGWRVQDLRRHYGDLNDLMIHFAQRAVQLARPGGVVSMIFNDSIFTSTDAQDLRRDWSAAATVLTVARTKCFEGKAVNGGVVVAGCVPSTGGALRWVEGYRKDVADLAEASEPLPFTAERGRMQTAGTLEVWSAPASDFRRLPHRPLFRPSAEALALLDRFESCAGWQDTWSRWDTKNRRGWTLLSNTRALDRYVETLRRAGFYDRLQQGDWVFLGLAIEGGVGLQTGDDRRFLAAVEGTAEAARHLAIQEPLEELTLRHPEAVEVYRRYLPRGREAALLQVSDTFGAGLGWPRVGTFRVAPAAGVRSQPLSGDERQYGIASGPYFVPFEKGDRSDTDEGHAIGTRWWRQNPLVIDWSSDAVALLRQRSQAGGARKPYWRNESLWFSEGVTWNRVASYLRCRQVPKTAIFGDKAPMIRPRPELSWLDAHCLLALLNSDTLDYCLRTLLGSRMMIEVGDVRRLPVPVLGPDDASRLSALGQEAVTTKATGQGRLLAEIETEVNGLVRRLYGIAPDAELWVVR